jgi:hypothetical protein
MTMVAVMKGDTGGVHPAAVSKARTILSFAPLLAEQVAYGMLPFGAVYREALYRKKVAKRMEAMKQPADVVELKPKGNLK